MKIQQRLMAILAAAFILSVSFPMLTVKADRPPEQTVTLPDGTTENDGEIPEEASSPEPTTIPEETTEAITEEETDEASLSEPTDEITEDMTDEASLSEPADEITEETDEAEDETDFPIPDEAPAFHAHIVYEAGDYMVVGTFTDFTPDIKCIDTLYSPDGVNWQTAIGGDWNLPAPGTDDESRLYQLQNQRCLFGAYEPLKSYKAGETDRFYLKLCITKRNGLSYETQSVTIERGGLQSIPEGTKCMARFSSAIAVREMNPYHYYGKYQLTVSAEATAEDISALLPDTLPVEVHLIGEANFNAICVVDCPVTWKPLSLPPLSAGESITIADAAEEVLVPKGTLLNTPLGTFQLEQPLSLNTDYFTDEVRLVLNISSENRRPAGVLREERNGLEIAFHQKPTGATSIQAYVLTEGEAKWTELPGLSLLKELNQPSTANSGYALVLRNDQEPYRSYLTATAAGDTPTPFFIGLKIEGGIYNGQQLVLAWPDVYEQLPYLPEVGGAGGNEGNAGADNRDDGTEGGQRPNLSQATDADSEELTPKPLPASDDNDTTDESSSDYQGDNSIPDQPALLPPKPEISESGQRSNLPQTTQDTVDTSSAVASGSAVQGDSRIFEWFDNSVQPPLVVQAATDIKNEESAETTIGYGTETDSRVPLLPVATAVTAFICIAAAARKTAHK